MTESQVHKFGERLRQARVMAGLSQEALAEKVAVSARTVINWEKGANYPELGRLFSIATATGTTEAWFFTAESSPHPEEDGSRAGDLLSLDRKLNHVIELLESQRQQLDRLCQG